MTTIKYPKSFDSKKYSENITEPEKYYGLPEKIQICKLCTYTNQKPQSEKEFKHKRETKKPILQLNNEGICRACEVNKIKEKIDWDHREKMLIEVCNKYRKNDGSYDCIVPGSGGKDSFFTAYKIKYEYGMNPLTITWAPHIYTDIGWKNLQSWIHSGLDNFLVTPNGRVHRLLTRLSLDNLLHPFQPFIFGQNFIIPKLASKLFNIDLIFYGESPSEYGNLDSIDSPIKHPNTYTVDDPDSSVISGMTLNQLKDFGITKKDLNLYLPMSLTELQNSKIEIHYLGFYKKWHPQEIFYFAIENSNFSPSLDRSAGSYSKYSSIDDKIDDLHYYTSYIKFGVGRATWDSGQEIRNKELTRSEGINLVKKYDGEYPKRFEKEIFEYLSIDKHEFKEASQKFEKPIMDKEYFDNLCNSFRSPHLWKFVNNEWKLRYSID